MYNLKKKSFIRFSFVVNVDYFKRSPGQTPSYWTDNDNQSIQCQTDTSCAHRMSHLQSIYQDKENVFHNSTIIALFLKSSYHNYESLLCNFVFISCYMIIKEKTSKNLLF